MQEWRYYQLPDGTICCGVHSRNKERVELPKVKNILSEVVVTKGEGKVTVRKMQMMRSVEDLGNYARVYPNFKHGGRKDAIFPCNTLSPMSLGPIEHGQPSFPPAQNLENMWQGSKCYEDEMNDKGRPTQKFFDTEYKMYLDDVPHRHKEQYKTSKCLFMIWEKEKKKLIKLPYVESRQIYCHFYAKYAREQDAFKKLKKLHDEGINICIYGYDGYEPSDDIEKDYLDPKRPFGHELVLYVMLKYKEEDWIWKKHSTLNLT